MSLTSPSTPSPAKPSPTLASPTASLVKPAALREQLLPPWSGPEIAVFIGLAAAATVLAWLYCFRMDRLPVFDEIGLHNPIYTYLTTGNMTYPMHGQPNAMFVHPPTHYWVTAELMKNLHLGLFDASAAPIFFFAVVAIVTLFTGRFDFPLAVAAVLALFTAIFIWSEFYTVRPDLHVTAAWIAGLLLLQAAKNHGWSHTRLFLGSAVSTYAATLHYWGVVAFLAVGVYALWFLFTMPRERWLRGLEMMAAGGLLVGGLYLVEFVIPQYDNIRTMSAGVQGDRGWHDAFERHRESYASFATRLANFRWPDILRPTDPNFPSRWLVDASLRPLFDNRWPAIFAAVPLLLIWRQTRPIAVAGAILPVFVLLYSQGKQVGYTGYFTPEIFLYLFGLFALGIGAVSSVVNVVSRVNGMSAVRLAPAVLAVGLAALAFREVPTSMGYTWKFRDDIDVLEANRAAGYEIVGPKAVVALTSAGNWYTAGGEIVWNAYNELYGLEQRNGDVRSVVAPADALVSQIGNWWNSQSTAAPLNLWYADGRLSLKGFVLNESGFQSMDQLYLTPAGPPSSPTGYLIGHDTIDAFVPSERGQFQVSVLVCGTNPAVSPTELWNVSVFPVATQPGKPGPQMVILAGYRADVDGAVSRLLPACTYRDTVRGDIRALDRDKFITSFRLKDRPMQFVFDRTSAAAAKAAADLQ